MAKPLFLKALSHALETDNQHLIANCHNYLGLVLLNDDPKGEEYLQQALELYTSLGDLYGISRITNNIALIYYDDPERKQEGKDLMQYSLQLKRDIGDTAGEARRLITLSLWAMEEEEFETAKEWLALSREICERLGELDRLSYALITQGLLYLIMTKFEEAEVNLERSLEIEYIIEGHMAIVHVYGVLSQLHLLQNNLPDAYEAILKGMKVATTEETKPVILIIAYANYLWHTHDLATCIQIIASLAQQELDIYSGTKTIVNDYFLQPLIYRIQQKIGEEAWQNTLDETAEITVDQLLNNIAQQIQMS